MANKFISSFLILAQLLALAPAPARAGLAETDQANRLTTKNYATNGGAENGKTGWTVSGTSAAAGDLALATGAANVYEGNAAFTWTPANADNYLTNTSVTITSAGGLSGANCAAIVWTKTTVSTHALEAYDGTNVLATVTIPSSTDFAPSMINWPCAAGTVAIRFNAGGTTAISFDSLKWGDARGINLSQVNQASLVASGYIATTASCTPNRTNTALGALATTSACPGATVETNNGPGTLQTTDYDGIKFAINSLPRGTYEVCMMGTGFSATAADEGAIAINDGTTTSGQKGQEWATGGGHWSTCGVFSYSTTANHTWELYVSSGSRQISIANNGNNEQTYFTVKRFPSTSELIYNGNAPKQPTNQYFTSGSSATYTTPNGVSYLEVTMCGPGGGGSGSGTTGASGNAGSAATTFGSLLTAREGGAGTWDGDAPTPSANTITAPAVKIWQSLGAAGSCGSARMGSGATSATPSLGGCSGGNSPFSGAGAGGSGGATGNGKAAQANSGSGGGSAYLSATTGAKGGQGGNSGNCLKARIPNPSPTYTYTIGTGGSGGTGTGSGTANGGAGADGFISVDEFYGAFNAPLVLQGVTTPQNTTGSTVINNYVSKSSTYTATVTDETILFTADATLNLPAAASVTGKRYFVMTSGSTTDVTIDPNASETVCGQTTILVTGGGDGVEIQSDGTNWIGLNGSCEHTVRAHFSIVSASSCTIPDQIGDWAASCSASSSLGTVTFISGLFSSTIQSCVCSRDNGNTGEFCNGDIGSGTFRFSVRTSSTGAVTNGTVDVICRGPR